MYKYLFGYRIEGALNAHATKDDAPYRFTFRKHDIALSFSDEEYPTSFICFINADGNSFQEANDVANEVVSEFLDVLSFIMKSSLFTIGLAVALKDESGKAKRVVFRNTTQNNFPSPLYLREDSAKAVQEILAKTEVEGNYDLSLWWLRYSYRARTWIEQFSYQWLALERLIGEKQIERECQNCHEKLPSYPSIDKDDVCALMQAHDPSLDKKNFGEIWKARQRTFHVGKIDTAFIRSLSKLSPRVSNAVEGELVKRYKPSKRIGVTRPNKVAKEGSREGFYEFTATDSSAPFAMNYPTYQQLLEFHKHGGVYSEDGSFQLISAEDKIEEGW